MITAESAGTIATIIPIGLLIVGFEIQRAPLFFAGSRAGTVVLWILGSLLVLSLFLGFSAEGYLITAVVTGHDLEPVGQTIVVLALYLLGLGSFLLLMGSLGERLGIIDRLAQRPSDRTAQSPRRRARQTAYIEKHHPSARRDADGM